MHLSTSSLAGPASSFLLAASSLLCLISLSTADDGTINFGTPLNNAATLNEDSNLILVRLYHAFNSSQQYQNRALITINNQVPIIKQDSINQELLEYLKESAISGDFYYLKAQAYRTLDMDNEEPYQVSTTFLRSCALLESLLSDQLVINLDVNGKFVFLSANVPGQYCAESSPLTASSMINAIGDNSNHFNTSIFLMKTSVNAGPETKTYLQRIEQERQEKLRGAKQDNRSFLAKYWMYIVPVVIFMVISGMNPEGGASG